MGGFMEEKNLKLLVANMNDLLDSRNYLEAFNIHRDILKMDVNNLDALMTKIICVGSLSADYFYRNEIKVTARELSKAILAIYKSKLDDKAKEKAFSYYVNFLDNQYFSENWGPEDYEDYMTAKYEIEKSQLPKTEDISSQLPKQYFYRYNYHKNGYTEKQHSFESNWNCFTKLETLAKDEMDLYKKIWKKLFFYGAVKKLNKKYPMLTLKNNGKKYILILGEKLMMRICQDGKMSVFVLGPKLTLETIGKDLCFPYKHVPGNDYQECAFVANQDQREYSMILDYLKNKGVEIRTPKFIYSNIRWC